MRRRHSYYNSTGINTKLFREEKESKFDMKSFLRKNKTASFWLDDELKYGYNYMGEHTKMNLMIKNFKAIRNFVRILTGKNIPVRYATREDTYFTTGESITISADINAFDITCGAALHEASHCLLTNFNVLKNFGKNIAHRCNEKGYNLFNGVDISGLTSSTKDTMLPYFNNYNEISKVISTIISIQNWIEDRRIDDFIIKNAPGYKGYYDALYKKYFFNKETSDLIAKTPVELNSRMFLFYIINSMNSNINVNALPGLKEIIDLIDIKNISRLKDTKEVLYMAVDIMNIIHNNLPKPKPQKSKSSDDNEENEDENESNDSSDNNETKSTTEEIKETEDSEEETEEEETEEVEDNEDSEEIKDNEEPEEFENDEESEDEERYEDDDENGSNKIDIDEKESGDDEDESEQGSPKEDLEGGDEEELSDKDIKMIENIIEQQEDFLDHNTKKKGTSDSMSNTIKNLSESDVDISQVGDTEVLIIKANQSPYENWENLGTHMLKSKNIEYYHQGNLSEENILEALNRGTQLGKKLQIRNEERYTKYSRLEHGKIENRQIYNLGYGNTDVFFQTRVDKYKKTHLHISIDASGSMGGQKIRNALMTTISIIKAASMTQNINVVVDMRCTENRNHICVVVYDSRKDNINKIKTTFRRLFCAGSTPEAIVFDGLLRKNYYVPSTTELNSFFLNFSDGEPTENCNETRKYGSVYEYNKAIVNKLRDIGIEVISYFISGDENPEDNYSYEKFKSIYGSDSHAINTSNLNQLAKTMNDKFLLKN
jgi:hypothetical protein